MQAIACSVKEAVTISGLGRTTLYRYMDGGKLAYRKLGKRRLVMMNSLRELVEGAGQDG